MTVEHTYKVVWALNSFKLYIDGALQTFDGGGTEVTTNVPDKQLVMFIELLHAAAQASETHIYGKDWRQL